ncbi:Clp protease N-terminal domain-containing protein [Actinomycetospora lutea]|uniref:Clp protease N-terminal domain-containing protein n=1 Tax=Actinomycetospora lutea TaxID=663604 RepID=UPI002366CE6C|nr:Clp protease N-terminal domain-containing protein [Actinomycetospora lutea]MDD7940873.1 Clp protease N-terminal domain-containing protein [Actinomycetospora lutea]
MGTTTPIHDTLAGAPLAVPVRPTPSPRAAPSVAEDAERVVALAWQEADERGHAYFGTGHLLLGLVRAGGTEAGVLAVAGVTAEMADAAMELVVLSSVSEPVIRAAAGARPLPGDAVADVLRDASRTVADVGDPGEVTAAGLLTALGARPWGQAAEMLAALGVDAAELAAAVATLAALAPEDADASPRPVPRDPSGLLSSAWRPAGDDTGQEIAEEEIAEEELTEA